MAELLIQRQLAEMLDLDPRQIRNLEKVGLPTSKVKGEKRYPWPKCLHWYLAHKVDAIAKRSDGKELDAQRLRKLTAEADLAELKAEQERGRLVAIDYMEQQTTTLLQRLRAKLLNAPSKHAPAMVGLRTMHEAQSRLELAFAEVMTALAETGEDPELDAGDDVDETDGDEAAPDASDGEA